MIKEILKAAGVLLPEDDGRFLRLPDQTHAAILDDIDVDGADPVPDASGLTRIYRHNVSVEVYEPVPDDACEVAIEAGLNARGIHWSKQARYWLQDVQRYQVIYEFTYTEKRRT